MFIFKVKININSKIIKMSHLTYKHINICFTGKLTEYQEKVFDTIYQILIKKNNVIIGCLPGFGKTILSIKLLCCLNLKTLIITNSNINVIQQWEKTINMFTNVNDNVNVNDPKNITEFDKIVIINYQNLSKIDNSFFSNFGIIIIDEIHLSITKKSFQKIKKFSNKYLIGMSATPYKYDIEENQLLKVLFSEVVYSRQQIIPKLKIIKTNIKYNMIFNIYDKNLKKQLTTDQYKEIYKISPDPKNVQLDWNDIINQQSENNFRNEKIYNLCKYHIEQDSLENDKKILILCKRKKQCDYIYKKLIKNFSLQQISLYYGNVKTFDRNCKVLISTLQKIGTGFDFPEINILIFSVDCVNYYLQYIGRCMRNSIKQPIIYEFLDDHVFFKNHLNKKIRETNLKFEISYI